MIAPDRRASGAPKGLYVRARKKLACCQRAGCFPGRPAAAEGKGGAVPIDAGYHWMMLNDYDRNAAYRAVIRRAAPGRVVYDLGAGVGTMSYYALRAGARRVYGFEVDRDAYAYLRKLRGAHPRFVPLRTDLRRGRLPAERPDVIVCEMWSAWLTEWPMVRVLNRIRRAAPSSLTIPARGYHVVQLVHISHRAHVPLELSPGTEAAVYDEDFATAEMSLPALACATDFQTRIGPVDAEISLVPLTSGIVNGVRLYSYEEVSPGRVLPRIGTRKDEILRWVRPLRVTRGRRVRVRIHHRWDASPRVRAE
jgi:predicted RNA methylase